ncbi:hypothetical protein T069G_01566 [Trichoderma breve]|uniref:Uncharacterized protein n=1 Tax=Trichoderma breve TaxID=2034170 RepID=A0A9W9JS41_9HYPO|nr:hypothetical protein T069G_01566 [Trichoderma breve]KAJ4865036.1 hypothetical protein T069G_01566 [Trichoderma breve]
MTAVAQLPLPLRHLITKKPTQISSLSLIPTQSRFSSTKTPRQASTPLQRKPILRDTIRRYIPEEAKKFVKPDGKLQTTPETMNFLIEHNLEPDNGAARRLTTGPGLQNVSKAYHATIAFSPRHIIHPHDLRFFDPRGHPLAAARRAKYLRKSQQEPLWIMITGAGAASVVRTLTQRRLKSAIYRSLEDLGFRNGVGAGKEIRGTLWITIHNPVAASKLAPEPFGEAVARALRSRCSQPLR